MGNFINITNEAILKESIFIIGSISSVEGRRVKVKVNKDKNISHLSYKGKIVKNVSVGSYIKIAKGFIEIIGKVEGEYITKEKVFNEAYNNEELKISRFLDVSLFGHFERGKFKQGIKEMPLIDNECYLLDKEEFNRLHSFYKSNEETITIGSLTEEPSQEIRLSIAKLFASHIGIFGNTGSGKSNTLAKIYTELFKIGEKYSRFINNSHFILIDFNGEYAKDGMISKSKRIYNLSTQKSTKEKYTIEQSKIEQLEIIAVLLEATEKTQKPFLSRALSNEYLKDEFEQRAAEIMGQLLFKILFKDIPSSISFFQEIFKDLTRLDKSEEQVADKIYQKLLNGELKYHSKCTTLYTTQGHQDYYVNSKIDEVFKYIFPNINLLKIIPNSFDEIEFKILYQYYREIFYGYSNQDHLRPLIGRMFKKLAMFERTISIKKDEKSREQRSIEIINLKNVNLEMKKTLPLIIVKQLYDEHKDVGKFAENSLHIIIDEAHNILSSFSERESETWKDYRLETFEEVIKEGRKFSTFLTIASQRPYDISPTIISQLHNYFIHRLINDNDIKAVEKTIAYLDKLAFESIPVLSVGSCFVAGLASDIPVKVDIDLLPTENQPRSETINLTKAWFEKTTATDEL